VINRERKKWKGLNKDIEIEEWKGFFRKQLGVKNKVIREGEREGVRRGEREIWTGEK